MSQYQFHDCVTNADYPAYVWSDIGNIWIDLQWTNYWFQSHIPCDIANLYTALRLIIEKINAMSTPPAPTPPTMGDILTAMLTAKYDELQSFIGIEDAYRSAIWQQPFNAEFYSALARGFMPWA